MQHYKQAPYAGAIFYGDRPQCQSAVQQGSSIQSAHEEPPPYFSFELLHLSLLKPHSTAFFPFYVYSSPFSCPLGIAAAMVFKHKSTLKMTFLWPLNHPQGGFLHEKLRQTMTLERQMVEHHKTL
ncbi:hypothetical protein AOLI_G00256050 [Acnodon oligacanthus]